MESSCRRTRWKPSLAHGVVQRGGRRGTGNTSATCRGSLRGSVTCCRQSGSRYCRPRVCSASCYDNKSASNVLRSWRRVPRTGPSTCGTCWWRWYGGSDRRCACSTSKLGNRGINRCRLCRYALDGSGGRSKSPFITDSAVVASSCKVGSSSTRSAAWWRPR